MAEVTDILEAIRRGELQGADDLFGRVCDELKKLACRRLAGEAPGQTLQPTELVYEVWLRLARGRRGAWQNRVHFVGAAAEAMRRTLVERARQWSRLKRGGRWERVDMDELDIVSPLPDEELLALDEALGRLGEFDARAAEVVKLCFLAGLTHEQAAKDLSVSLSTIERTWTFARARLFHEIEENRASLNQVPAASVKETSEKRPRGE